MDKKIKNKITRILESNWTLLAGTILFLTSIGFLLYQTIVWENKLRLEYLRLIKEYRNELYIINTQVNDIARDIDRLLLFKKQKRD